MIRPMPKYTGKYRDLMPTGYKFQKLFARNYRCYYKEFGICEEWLKIWQKGNDIEIMDLYSKSGWVINLLIKHREKIPALIDNNSLSLRMNTKNGRCWNYDGAERRHVMKIEKRMHDRMKKYGNTAWDLYFKKWRMIYMEVGMITEILRLYDADLIRFEDEEFK